MALVLAALSWPLEARAAAFMTREEALAQAFPGARIGRRSFALGAAEAATVEKRARVKLPSRLVIAYFAWRGDSLTGTAFFDARVVRTMPAVLMVAIAPDTTVSRIDVLAFHEPPDYAPEPRWLSLFAHRRLDDRMWPGRAIPALSGATLTARAIGESARLALALYEIVAAPALARKAVR
ncbi:MAG: FMN-binding protein [Candidatus Eisenbacteria bacterium]|uniref:FMN-binding protein n=1 Tax=Eiseniibacteriota bacterium TaxID=2212470 RepID=A0A538TUZ2_UNCEI|nr:MAG: FMN-binding protein [Candidatus Eisenbacteria bacterium]